MLSAPDGAGSGEAEPWGANPIFQAAFVLRTLTHHKVEGTLVSHGLGWPRPLGTGGGLEALCRMECRVQGPGAGPESCIEQHLCLRPQPRTEDHHAEEQGSPQPAVLREALQDSRWDPPMGKATAAAQAPALARDG